MVQQEQILAEACLDWPHSGATHHSDLGNPFLIPIQLRVVKKWNGCLLWVLLGRLFCDSSSYRQHDWLGRKDNVKLAVSGEAFRHMIFSLSFCLHGSCDTLPHGGWLSGSRSYTSNPMVNGGFSSLCSWVRHLTPVAPGLIWLCTVRCFRLKSLFV